MRRNQIYLFLLINNSYIIEYSFRPDDDALAEPSADTHPDRDRDQSAASAGGDTAATPSMPTSTKEAKRGQKKKKQKAKDKYGDQDDDDRALAMDLLSSAGAVKPKGNAGRKAKRQARKERGQVGSKHIEARGTQSKEAPSEAVDKIMEHIARKQEYEGDCQ